MSIKRWVQAILVTLTLSSAIGLVGNPTVAKAAKRSRSSQESDSGSTAVYWETSAGMHRGFLRSKDRGTLSIDEKGVEFQSKKCLIQMWKFLDIDTFSFAPNRLVLKTYTNRSLHRPGEQSYRFDMTQTVPPTVAAMLARGVARPSRNMIPDIKSPEIVSIHVHHRRPTGGTNGILRFREQGIDYVTTSSRDSRSWRWADLQTLSDPDPYHLFVFGYQDTYTFDLKEPLPSGLFNRVTDEIYTQCEQTHEQPGNPCPQTTEKPRDEGRK